MKSEAHLIPYHLTLSQLIPLHSTLYRVIPPYPAHIDNDRHLSRGRDHGVGGQRLVRPRRWSGVLLGTIIPSEVEFVHAVTAGGSVKFLPAV